MMGKEARDEDLELTEEERSKFLELVALLSKHGFGESGPPWETSFATIEAFGHRAGRMLGRAIDAHLVARHAEHVGQLEPCPACGESCPERASPHDLPLCTVDGKVAIPEPAFRCPSCERDFFPGASAPAD